MPNWCNNFLQVSPTNEKSKEAQAQLRKFIADVNEEGQIISTKEAKKYRENFLKENFEKRYRDAADVFVSHSEMPLEKFMKDIAFFSYNDKNKTFATGALKFSMQKILPVPMDLLHPDLESYGGDEV